jgi:hypothetical protein
MAWMKSAAVLVAVSSAVACGPPIEVDSDGDESTGADGTVGSDTTGRPQPLPTTGDSGDGSGDGVPKMDLQPNDLPGPGCQGDCSAAVDILVVVDNSANMGRAQAVLTRTMTRLVADLENFTDEGGNPFELDVQVMVTTTDMGNQLCTPFQPDGYSPAAGSPIATGCNARIANFTGLTGTVVVPEVCTAACPADIVAADPFIAFTGGGLDNVPNVEPADVDGDGQPDSSAAQALACLVPQGINGCGYESPLEATLQALNPGAAWNTGPRPFLRDEAALGIILLTDEADCSIGDVALMTDASYYNVDPSTGMAAASSALCYNAGVQCSGPDAGGIYADCTSIDGPLQPVTRYTDFLAQYLRDDLGKQVFMAGLIGVPTVTSHNPDPPFEPVSGGVFDLVVRNWQNGQYPAGDIAPTEWAQGVTAADKEFLFGVGPACTGLDAMGGLTSQAIPSQRVMDVCQALDFNDGVGDRSRCSLESICDADYGGMRDFVRGVLASGPGPIID